VVPDLSRADLLYPTEQAVKRCYVCRERLFGECWFASPHLIRPLWWGVHQACTPGYIDLCTSPQYRAVARIFLQTPANQAAANDFPNFAKWFTP
jgi:hypothetical protein